MEKILDKFMDEEFFLSNFYPSVITYKGKEYKTVEHAYQSSKADNEPEHEWVRSMDTAGKSKRAGYKVHLRKDWEEVKDSIMLELLYIKFSNPVLANKLVNTKNYQLEEGNYWHDNYFGNCTCSDCRNIEGQNKLGKMLMKIREELIFENK